MKLRLTPQADTDLEDISAYLEPRSPQGSQRVEAAIQEAFALIRQYPEIGHLLGRRRRFTLPRYPYLIFYRVDEAGDAIEVLAVRHSARQPVAD